MPPAPIPVPAPPPIPVPVPVPIPIPVPIPNPLARACDAEVPNVIPVRDVAPTLWIMQEALNSTHMTVWRNHVYNLQARRINRARSHAVPGNASRAWPKYIKMVEIVNGEVYHPAPNDKASIHAMTQAQWMLLGAAYQLPWVPVGPGRTTRPECRRDYKAFIGMRSY